MLLEALDSEMARSRHPAGFFSGSVTFAEMQPMRGIPFRVVCLIGMNDRAFPRQSFPAGFHLMPQCARPGDRDMGKDDRYVFLEALLAARDVLYISYTGQSQQDNAPLPPSVLVSELLDELTASYRVEGRGLKEHICCTHYLQPFNANYFVPGSRLQSYSQQYLDCARALQGDCPDASGFFEQQLPEAQEAGTDVSLDELVRFFKNPLEYLLRERLNVSLKPQVFSITERESFQLEGLDRFGIEQELLQECIAEAEAEGSFVRFAARGLLPHGPAGRVAYAQTSQLVRKFAHDVSRFCAGTGQPENRLFELSLGDCTLSASVDLMPDAGLVCVRHAAIRPIDFLKIWLDYLVCSAAEGTAPNAVLAGLTENRQKTRLWQFSPVEDPCAVLTGIIALYREGQRSPLAFMPQASFAYAEALNANKTEEQARAAAAGTLEQSAFKRSDLDDVSFNRFFDAAIVETPDFDRCARKVFGPVLRHRQKKL
jgi:exodeoxyribonuclease V gamma subunit